MFYRLTLVIVSNDRSDCTNTDAQPPASEWQVRGRRQREGERESEQEREGKPPRSALLTEDPLRSYCPQKLKSCIVS